MFRDNAPEVESFVKNSIEEENSLGLSNFATIRGIRGRQFGRDIYTAVLPFKDLMDFLEVFPEVQRQMLPKRVTRIKNYVLSGVGDRDNLRFFSAITVTCRGYVFYDENTNKVAIDTNQSKLSINDGQHRFFGIAKAIEQLENKVRREKDDIEQANLIEELEELKNMVIPLVIFNQIGDIEEKQLFHDLNNLAQRPSRSATIKLAQTDIYSHIARDIAETNKYLTYYGVETDKQSLSKSNPNGILLTTIYRMIKQFFWKDYVSNKNFINKSNYEEYLQIIDHTFNQLFMSVPSDMNSHGKYILSRGYSMSGIAKFIHHCRAELLLSDEKIFKAISEVDWSHNMKEWGPYGATEGKEGNILFGGSGYSAIESVYNRLLDNLSEEDRRNNEQITLEEAEQEAQTI